MRENGFEVENILVEDVTPVRAEYGIPQSLESCHVALIEGYFVEGHVPVEAINKLLTEKPNIDGIVLPGMPSGSPGMPGPKTEEFVIYAVTGGEVSEFMVLP